MSAAVEFATATAIAVAVVADPSESVADVLLELQALGFAPQRVSLTAIGGLPTVPAVALVVGSGTRAGVQARCACAGLRARPQLARVPIVVVLPAGRVPIADPALDAHELIVRPLRRGELLSRISRATAAAPVRPAPQLSIAAGPLRIDPASRGVWISDRPVAFSAREFELLHHLARFPARVHTRPQLLRAVWRDEAGVGTRAVDVQVRRVRARLGHDLGCCIRTVRSVGYAFDERGARSHDPA